MNLWIDKQDKAQHQWLRKWTWVKSVPKAISTIKNNQEDDPVTLISVESDLAETFLEQLNELGGVYEVVIRGEASARAVQLIIQNHWNHKVMDDRTAEIIMVLKGNHDLADNLPADVPKLGTYLQDIALYLSDDCFCPFSYYAKHPGCMSDVIHNAVTDYMKACYNPSFLLWEYFQAKRQWGDMYNDDQCWCVALVGTAVRDNGKYINGWNDHNTRHYQRQRPFLAE